MAGEWGHTLPPEAVDTDLANALAEPPRPPQRRLPPGRWARENLFHSPLNSILTLALLVVGAVLAYRLARFVFVTARWEPVRENLTVFMMGTFPRDEQWRLVAQLWLLAGGVGLLWGAAVSAARDRAAEAGTAFAYEPLWSRLRRYWALVLFVAALLLATRTLWPTLMVVGAVALLLVLQAGAARLARGLRPVALAVAAELLIASFQVLTGTGGTAWVWTTLPLAALAYRWVAGLELGDRRLAHLARLGAVAAVAVAVRLAYAAFEVDAVGWDAWRGLHLTLVSSFVAIVLAFPLGLLLALARRSTMPAMRAMSTAYIELIRGVPLISLLLMGEFFIGFFLDTDSPLSQISRAITVMTMFTAAYVAEIVRGGLQAVPRGQVEAAQSLGLAPTVTMRRVVLPQALRAVIPAMVGQFISLFKDTTLLSIIGIQEFLGVRNSVHAQAAFRSFGIAETLVFVAFGFWAVAFTMSRESQRLERRLGVGER